MLALPPLDLAVLPARIRSRFVDRINGLRGHVLEARARVGRRRGIVGVTKRSNVMGRRLIGEAAMTDAERRQRRRGKAKALRDAAPKPLDQHDVVTVQANGSVPDPDAIATPPAGKPGADHLLMLAHPDGCTTIAATTRRPADG